MFNAIANTFLIATRTDKDTAARDDLYRHEDRKREELNRLKTNAYFHPTSGR